MDTSTMLPIVNIVLMMVLSDKPFNSQMVLTLLLMMAPQVLPALIQWCKSHAPVDAHYIVEFHSKVAPTVFRAVSEATQKLVTVTSRDIIVGTYFKTAASRSTSKGYVGKFIDVPITCPMGVFTFERSGVQFTGKMDVNLDGKEVKMSLCLGVPRQHKAALNDFVQDAIRANWQRTYSKLGHGDTKALLTWKEAQKRWHPTMLSVKKTFENLWLPNELARAITDDLDAFRGATAFYERRGMPHKRGMLFYGPPGTGKTSCIFAISHYLQYDVYRVGLRMCTTDVKRALRKIKQAAIVVIEEVDLALSGYGSVVGPRKGGDDKHVGVSSHDNEKLALLMEYLDGYVNHTPGTVIIFTTNNKDDIPKALIRPGRIDRRFHFLPLHGEDVARVARNFTEEPDLVAPEGVVIPAADLINTVLMPHIGDKGALQRQLSALK